MDLTKMELDKDATRKNARQILKAYKSFERQSGQRFDLQAVKLSDMPKSPSDPRTLSDRIVRRMDAERECKEIIKAWSILDQRSKQIIFLSYLSNPTYTALHIAMQMGYSDRNIERLKAIALIEFAEAYKGGEIIVWKDN